MYKDQRQQAYERYRKAFRDEWWISETEDFCARKEVDPMTGKWLIDSVTTKAQAADDR